MDNKDTDEIVATCRRYGNEDPQLWVQALSYFSKLKSTDGSRREIQQILQCSLAKFFGFSHDEFVMF